MAGLFITIWLYKMELVNRVSTFQNSQNFLMSLPKDWSKQVKIASQ